MSKELFQNKGLFELSIGANSESFIICIKTYSTLQYTSRYRTYTLPDESSAYKTNNDIHLHKKTQKEITSTSIQLNPNFLFQTDLVLLLTKQRSDSKISMEETASEMAPMAVPLVKALSVSWLIESFCRCPLKKKWR